MWGGDRPGQGAPPGPSALDSPGMLISLHGPYFSLLLCWGTRASWRGSVGDAGACGMGTRVKDPCSGHAVLLLLRLAQRPAGVTAAAQLCRLGVTACSLLPCLVLFGAGVCRQGTCRPPLTSMKSLIPPHTTFLSGTSWVSTLQTAGHSGLPAQPWGQLAPQQPRERGTEPAVTWPCLAPPGERCLFLPPGEA